MIFGKGDKDKCYVILSLFGLKDRLWTSAWPCRVWFPHLQRIPANIIRLSRPVKPVNHTHAPINCLFLSVH